MATRPLNPTAASLLGFLHDGPRTGWDLAAMANTLIGDFWSLTQSQVYRELAAMADAGLVEAGERGQRERLPYTITAAGRAAFAEWVSREPGPETIRFPLLLAISFGRHLEPERLAEFIRRHRTEHARRLERYQQMRAVADAAGAAGSPPDPYVLATLEFGLGYERMVLAWLDGVLRAPTPGHAKGLPAPRRGRAQT